MKINYHQRKFRSVSNTESGEVSESTVFLYFQEGDVLWATYQGGSILKGTMTGIVNEDGIINFAYQHVNVEGKIMTGRCKSVPKQLDDGRIRLNETWQWTCGDYSKGRSIVEELSY